MTVITLDPDGTLADHSDSLFGGAGTVHASLADSDDATGIDLSSIGADEGWVEFTFEDLDLSGYPDSIVKTAWLVIRSNYLPGQAPDSLLVALRDQNTGATHAGKVIATTWQAITSFFALEAKALTDGEIDNIETVLAANGAYAGGAIPNNRIYKASLAVIIVEPSTVTMLAPSGTFTDDDTPTVRWGGLGDGGPILDSDGGSATHFEVVVVTDTTAALPGFDPEDPDTFPHAADSGIVTSSATEWEIDELLADGDYVAFARVAQTVNNEQFWGSWPTGIAFEIDVLRPAVPSFVLTPQATAGRTRIEVQEGVAGDVSTDEFQIEHSYDGGDTWVQMRTLLGDGLLASDGGEATAWDLEALNGTMTNYRVRAVHNFDTDARSFSQWVLGATVWTSNDWWLKHPYDPGLNWKATLRSQPSQRQQSRRGAFYPLGREHPIIVTDVRTGWQGEVVFRQDSDDDRAALAAIIADNTPLLLQSPEPAYWTDRWVSLGDLDQARVIDQSWGKYTFDSMDWIEVDIPTGNMIAWPDPSTPPLEEGENVILV